MAPDRDRPTAMTNGAYPCFLDIEASGFGEESYPIEAAWSNPTGEIFRNLINPDSIPDWTSWSEEAERIHHIGRDRLRRCGRTPDYVASRIANTLGGRTVYSDAPDYDGRWLERLFHAVRRPQPFNLEHIDELLIAVMRGRYEMVWQVIARIDKLKHDVAAVRVGKHSAGYDVGYLLQLWRRANGHVEMLNHGIGTMPLASGTGRVARDQAAS